MLQVFRPRRRFQSAAIAVAASLAAAGIRHACIAYLGLRTPLLILHVAAIALVSQYLGTGPGLISTAVSYGLLLWQLNPIPDPITATLFCAVGVGLSVFGGRRLRTEVALQEANEDLAIRSEVARIGTFDWDVQTGRIEWSTEVQQMYGARLNSFDAWRQAVHTDDLQRIEAELESVSRSGRPNFDSTFRVRRPDGRTVWIHSRGKFTFDRSGRAVHMFGVNMDVTELKRAEEALRQTNAQLEAILDSIPEPMMVTDGAGKTLKTNAAFRNSVLFKAMVDGLPSRAEAQTESGRRIAPEDWPLERVRRGERISNEDLILSVDGMKSHRRFSGTPVFDESGKVINAIVTFFDITDQKRMAAELQRANETMDLAFAAGNSGGWAWDVETGELYWTRSYYGFLGVDPSVKPTPELFYSLVHPNDLEQVRQSISDALAGRITEFRTEFRVRNATGIRWFERRGRVFRNSEGKPQRLVGISTDITERKILRGLLPTCAQCKKIRDEQNNWQPLESYISEHSDARFSHGLCPGCADGWIRAGEMGDERIAGSTG